MNLLNLFLISFILFVRRMVCGQINLFEYMRRSSIPDTVDYLESYDFIVIGAGSGGCYGKSSIRESRLECFAT